MRKVRDNNGILIKASPSRGTLFLFQFFAVEVSVRGEQVIKDFRAKMEGFAGTGEVQPIAHTEPELDLAAEPQLVFDTVIASEYMTKACVVDYLSEANRDIMVYEQGSYVQRYVYGQDGERISAEFTYAEGTRRGEPGENLASDNAEGDVKKLYYRRR